MKKVLLLSFLIFIFISSCYAVDFPSYNPQNKYVTDTANVIDDVWESQISSLLAEIEKNTTAEIAVVTVSTTGEFPIEQYSIELAEKWGIGKADVDNGLLILIAVDDRKYRIEVGYGLEGILNDAKVGRVGRTFFVDNFRDGNYGEGIFLAVQAIGMELHGEESILSQTDAGEDNTTLIIFFIIVSIWTIPWILRAIAKKYGKQVGPHQWLLWGITFNMLGRGRGGGGFGGGGFSGGGSGGFGGGGFGGGGSSGGW